MQKKHDGERYVQQGMIAESVDFSTDAGLLNATRKKPFLAIVAALFTGCLLSGTLANSAKAADLRFGVAAMASSVDPHFYNRAANLTLAMHLFDRLVQRGSDSSLQPGLALSWKPISDTVWEFRLRPDVKWHDGQPFTADDVAFTLVRAKGVEGSPSNFGGFLRPISKVYVIDPLTLHIHTKTPAPNLPGNLANIAIVSKHAGESAKSEDYNSGKAAIGTGPYRLVSFKQGDRVEMERNPDWWGPRPEWDNVSLIGITNASARVAGLLAGDVDIIDQPPLSNLEQLNGDDRVSVISKPGLRVIFLGPDVTIAGSTPFATDLAGKPLAENPLRNLKVRQALSLAINRTGLAERVMQGAATPTAQWMPEGKPGYVSSLPVAPQDLDGAKALLAEAGFPEGFKLAFQTPNDRYPNDAAIAQAIAQMWTRIGVQTAVEAMPTAVHSPRGLKHEFLMGLWGWSNNTAEAGAGLVSIMGTEDKEAGRGAANVGGYANSKLDQMTSQALSTLDDSQRNKLLAEAVEIAITDVAVIPLFHLNNVWAARKGLDYDAREDEQNWAVGVHTAK